ncbi:MAG TPA: hypothetical protein VHO84_14515 [Syntrophorhabdaceae bacterium]|nr:hypothetical protein [Syntrophorhabdaceae bacterium]
MREDKNSLIVSFLLGSIVGGGIAVLATQYYLKRKYFRQTASDASLTQSNLGDYCAPEGADLHYDLDEEEDQYYSESRI